MPDEGRVRTKTPALIDVLAYLAPEQLWAV
jgi:hypothetical protein